VQIGLVAAMDKHRLIGAGNAMPWHLPADMKRFRAVTMGKTIVMGRRTFASIGKPLPGRDNWVVTSQGASAAPDCTVFASPTDAFDAAVIAGLSELVIIGGGQIYESFMPRATHLYITRIDAALEGDTWFPQWPESKWQLVESEWRESDDRNKYPMTFETWQRSAAES
jgi:dihydrofolate reductase